MTDGMLLREFLGEPDMESYRSVSYVGYSFNLRMFYEGILFVSNCVAVSINN